MNPSSNSASPRAAAPRSLAAVLCRETLQPPHAPDGGGTTTGRRRTNRHVLRHLQPADDRSCASRGGGGVPDSKTLPEYPCDPHVMEGHSQSRAAAGTPTACCVRVSCLITRPLGLGWVCVWRGAGGRGGGGGAG